ncbi:MAG: heparinase II/III family protein [Variibacter sp.]
MSRGLFAERTKLSMFVLSRGARRLASRLSVHPLLRWRFASARSDRLLIAPQDLRTADPTRASEIYGGRFAFAGKIVICDGRSPFELNPPSPEWAEALLTFGWLRHLRAADSAITRSNARALIDEWITLQGTWHSVAWKPEVLARRIIAWLTHAPFVLHDADVRFYRRFMRSLTRQVRYLRGAMGTLRDGQQVLEGLIALNYAALCMAGQGRLLKPAGRQLVEELQRQILPDGGHISRNPEALIELLLDLLPLRQAFGGRNVVPPVALINAIDRMMPMLRFFRHGDGGFANFNGMGPTPPDLLATVAAYDDARGRPVASATHSGYQRLEAKGSVVLIDTGTPPPLSVSHEAHAGCLSFEFSVRRHRLVVNCGLPAVGRDSWRHVSRTTAAHSTVTVDDASSCRFVGIGSMRRLVGATIVSGPENVPVEREDDDDGVTLIASHDGYAAPFSMVHQRRLTLSYDGRRLDGEDRILPWHGFEMPRNAPDRFAVRFHLHPTVRANRLTHRRGVMLMLPNRDVWLFESHDEEVKIEESVYLPGRDGPRRTAQIVIYGQARRNAHIAWSFVQADPTRGGEGRPPEEPELPL